jgi:hypothetical protein
MWLKLWPSPNVSHLDIRYELTLCKVGLVTVMHHGGFHVNRLFNHTILFQKKRCGFKIFREEDVSVVLPLFFSEGHKDFAAQRMLWLDPLIGESIGTREKPLHEYLCSSTSKTIKRSWSGRGS